MYVNRFESISTLLSVRVAVLDEPTSGLDPQSRRSLWDIMIEIRKTCAILLSTHYMEEAEALADNVSIMSRGQLICHGTSAELKQRFAEGYALKILTKSEFDLDATLQRLRKHIPDVMVKSFVRPTLIVVLPYGQMKHYADAIAELEANMAQLRIESLSLTDAGLEEVFIKLVHIIDFGTQQNFLKYFFYLVLTLNTKNQKARIPKILFRNL